ncbi:hypothetical protein ASPWEDRAFT_40790 [Aspergillus wentii DTO 134E9]|uniref:Uncharacterized protein n=1 Tax=Aspergillus wentii DTO 134E9 TaxID=1073089 RepID=A0A1L9RKX1_ASPWE|nr:uncharacterized protein ASPWEDRAFT_40790 [Aspergillus wentii DTO 134E9]OJJ35586.1 hypothetical protein ASPWEDRAFT_40790 [Aspergillus wentii DTO 134E9]
MTPNGNHLMMMMMIIGIIIIAIQLSASSSATSASPFSNPASSTFLPTPRNYLEQCDSFHLRNRKTLMLGVFN